MDEAWRAVREGQDPLLASRSLGRWSDGSFDVLYASTERDGAVAEIFALLRAQPVFPSRVRFLAHRLSLRLSAALLLPDLAALTPLGVDVTRWRERDYVRTQAIAEAAHFLGFDGLVAPSARWDCLSVVAFTERLELDALRLVESETAPINWTRGPTSIAARSKLPSVRSP